MSSSMHIVGIVAPDAMFKKMKKVYDSCIEAGVDVPKDVSKFFNGEEPDDAGVVIELDAKSWGDDMREGLEIEVSNIPKHIKTIRFYNAY